MDEADIRDPGAARRALPDAALCGPGRREMLWVHGSLSAPLARRVRGRRVRMVTRATNSEASERDGAAPQRD